MLNWICCIFAVLIALVVSSLELLTKYEAKKFKEIFGSAYYWAGFVPLNAVFSGAVYWALPDLSKLVLKSDLTTNLEQPVLRAIVAGLGYLVVVKTSIVDLQINGKTQGIGFDILYNTIAGFVLRHHENTISRRERELFRDLYALFTDPRVYLGATQMLEAADDTFKREIQVVINTLVAEKPPQYNVCYRLYRTLLESMEASELKDSLQFAQTQIESDSQFEQDLTNTLEWLSLPPFPSSTGNP